GQHPALRASAAAFASVPAPVLRWGVGQFDPSARTGAVSGHTVVSSVNRGPADLDFGGHRVLFTAGYPALSPVMGLTHGVHGIGDTVAISVHADPTAVDIEDYLDRLADALP
ncbi:MAG: WS/DGAT domain-containing protein, partial [Mycobacterium sp.]